MVIELTRENFNEIVKSDKPVLVDFWASWCGPCRMVSPVIDQLAEEYAGKISVGKVNVDDEGALVVLFPDGHTEAINSGEVSVRGMYGYI